MKKMTLLTMLAVFALALTACAGNSTSSNRPSTNGQGQGRGNFRNITMTPELKLAVGTLKLENTPQAINAATAQKLIPLWQLMDQLNTSSTTAPQETAAVVSAIQQAMTPAQVSAIDSMNLTSQDIFTSFQQQGGQGGFSANGFTGGQGQGTNTNRFTGSGGTTGSNNSGTRRTGGQGGFAFGGGGGGFPGGGFPGGGFGGGGGFTNRSSSSSSTSSSSSQSQQSQFSQETIANRISNIVIQQVLQLLQGKLAKS